MKKICKLLSILLLISLLCLGGCSKRNTQPAAPTEAPVTVQEPVTVPETEVPVAPTAEPTEAPVVVETTPMPISGLINPLTGEAVSEDISAARPFAVQMNNHQDALPQCGISAASIIYEMPEEGITRMTAIYPQTPACEHFGSVRSARPYHSEVAKSYDAIFVHWGSSTLGAQSVYQLHKDDDVDFCGNAAAYSYRDPSRANRATEHTGFVTVERLKQFLSDDDRRLTHEGEKDYGLRFSDSVELNGGSAEKLSVYFASKKSDFAYDAAKGSYTMSQYNGIPYVDGDTNLPVEFKNVLILRTYIADETSLASISLHNTKGNGILCCNGKQEAITWEHGEYDDCFHYYRSNGSELVLGVGRSYICIIAYDDSVVVE